MTLVNVDVMVVGDTERSKGVAGRCDSDLLLPVPGVWWPHRFLQLQPSEVSSNLHYYTQA